MSTRANIYVCDKFIAEVASDAYPVKWTDSYYNDSLWSLLIALDSQHCTEGRFRDEMTAQAPGPEYLPPESSGVGNWTYEYIWVPFYQPKDYCDWEHWGGRVFVREIDYEATWKKFGSSYWQVPGPWIPISEWDWHDKENE